MLYQCLNKIFINYHFFNIIKLDHYYQESSGFVYGAMSSFCGVACGAVLMVIQYYMPNVHKNSAERSLYFKWILAYGCGGLAIFGILITIILIPMEIGRR